VKKRTKELMIANEELRRISFLDGLTGIANRRYFDEFLEREWHRAKRGKTSLALLMLDVDCFKNYNDTYGHLAGDECLKKIATLLKATMKRPTDLAVRYGGEEFAVVLPDTNVEGARIVGEKIRRGVEQLGISHKNSSISKVVTISIGIATMSVIDGGEPITMIADADNALYQAKQCGRNQIKIAESSREGV
jgi:two-component system, chemotaxis family, response regulator WspR